MAANKLPVTIREDYDEHGVNKIISHCTDTHVEIFLKLKSENRKRRLGIVTKSTKTLKIKRNREKHLYRMGNAYGFNEYLLREATRFDKVWLRDEHAHWTIPVAFILDPKNGFYLHHLQQGFELQKFISLGELEQFRVKQKENRRF